MAPVTGDVPFYVYLRDQYRGTFYLPRTLTPGEAKALIVKTGDFTEEIEVRKAPDGNPDSQQAPDVQGVRA